LFYTLKWFSAKRQLWIGITHLFDASRTARHTTFLAASSLGNTFRFLVALRMTLFNDSMALVV
jgi:hypothetical protein